MLLGQELKFKNKLCNLKLGTFFSALAGKGYGKNCKEFTPMQVSYILYFLGEP